MQNRALREYAARRSWTVAMQVREVSSGAVERKAREQLMEAARRREIDVVLVWRLDRWGRSVTDVPATLQEMEHLGIGFVSLTEALDLSRRQPVARWPAIFAEFEREILRERTRAGLAQARLNGKQLGRPITAGRHATEIRKLHRAGIAKAEIARRLEVGRTWVRRILANVTQLKKPRRDPIREDRIENQAIVDASPEEQPMGWYYYLENKIGFPFAAKCIATKVVSPLRKGETVEAIRMGPEKITVRTTCSCWSDGRAGKWPSLFLSWSPSTRTSPPRKPSATGITGSRRATSSELMPEAKRRPRSQPACTDIKARLASFDRRGLIGLIQVLFAAHKQNRTFLHARFGSGSDALRPYKETLDRWLWPDVLRNQDTSVAKSKQAISSYKKAVGDPAGLAEPMVFYCERAAGFCNDLGNQDEGYFDALVRMFEQALKVIGQLPAPDRNALIDRLDRIRAISHNFGDGIGDDMDSLLARHSAT